MALTGKNRTEMSDTVLEMQKISKRFPGVQALNRVDFSCARGEVHALAGENGAGKSTLVKILAGAYRPDAGKIVLRGEEISMSSPKEAQLLGVSIIYQEFNLIPDLDVAENIFLGREPLKRWNFINISHLYRRSKDILADLGSQIDLRTKVKNLSVAQQQAVEIAKALSLNADIIIMDEPSSVVSGKELEALFHVIRSLRESGKAIIYISHRIHEIFQIADRVTVLKDGELVNTVRTRDVDKDAIISMMVGRSFAETFPPRERGERREILRLENVSRDRKLRNISLSVYTGEILGIAGLGGSGRTELARVIFGADPIASGAIYFDGEKVRKISPKASISSGIGFVTEDRKKEGLIHNLSVRVNLTLAILDKIKRWSFIQSRKEKDICNQSVTQFNIMTPTLEQEIQYLSGGNQQKVIVAKWVNANPRLIIMDEPTRGIDVGAKAEIYNLMRRLVKQGTGIIMISSELPEIIGMSDRIVVMHDGQIMGELSPSDATEEGILALATGAVKQNYEGDAH